MGIAEEITQALQNELMEEIKQDLILPDIEEDEVTARMIVETLGVCYSSAVNYLRVQEQNGKLTSRKVKLPNGKPSTAYRKAV